MTEKKKQKKLNFTFFLKGEGMNRRFHNIEKFKELIKSGLSFNEIVKVARKYFNFKKINEYYDIALDEVNNPDEESFKDYVKRREKEKEGKK